MHFIGAMPDCGCSCGCSHRNVCSSHEAAPQVSGGKSGIVLLSPSDQVYRCAILQFCDGGWRKAFFWWAISPYIAISSHRLRHICTG